MIQGKGKILNKNYQYGVIIRDICSLRYYFLVVHFDILPSSVTFITDPVYKEYDQDFYKLIQIIKLF